MSLFARDLERGMNEVEVGSGHRKVTILAGLGWMFDAMDIGLLAFVVAALAAEWDLAQISSYSLLVTPKASLATRKCCKVACL